MSINYPPGKDSVAVLVGSGVSVGDGVGVNVEVGVGVCVGVCEGVEDGMKYVALGVAVGPWVGVMVRVGDSKTAVGLGRVGVTNSGVAVAINSMVGVAVLRFFTELPTPTMINPSR